MNNPLAIPLQQYLSERYPGAVLDDFQFLTSGFESDVYTFLLRRPGQIPQPLILRLYPGEGAGQKMAREAAGLVHLQEAGYPVPVMLLSEPNPAVLGKPFNVMEKLEGSSLWPVLASAKPDPAAHLLRRFGALQARLHALDWRPFTTQREQVEADPSLLLVESIAASRQQYAQFDLPGFLTLSGWLEDQRKHIQVEPTVAHLDFHANNVFLGSNDRMSVIDWTQVCVSDYRADLSWTLFIMGDFGKREWSEQILRAYREASGRAVGDLAFFDVISYTKLLFSTVVFLKSNPTQLGMRSEAAGSIQQQVPVLRMLAERIQKITGLTIPEVEAILA